jgi:hypothetical protein
MIGLVVECANRLGGGALTAAEATLMGEEGQPGSRRLLEGCGLAAVAWAGGVLSGIERGLAGVSGYNDSEGRW